MIDCTLGGTIGADQSKPISLMMCLPQDTPTALPTSVNTLLAKPSSLLPRLDTRYRPKKPFHFDRINAFSL